MTYKFIPAVRQNAALMIGLAGPSGSGKTFSALRLGTGLANGKPLFMIDTENGRACHYADLFDFQYAQLQAPFSPDRYMEIIKDAIEQKPGCVIVDSMSHCHEGEGGVLEMHEAELDRMAGSNFEKRDSMNFRAWIKPKAAHNKLVNYILQSNVSFIFCFRAKDKMVLAKDNKGKMKPLSMGWQPICTDRFEYEMTALLVLPPGARGIPDLAAKATKMEEQHRELFASGQQLGEDTGKALAAWAAGGKRKKTNGKATKSPPAPNADASAPDAGDRSASAVDAEAGGGTNDLPTIEDAKMEALQGEAHLRGWYKGLGQKAKKAIYDDLEDLMKVARKVDAEKEPATFGGDG